MIVNDLYIIKDTNIVVLELQLFIKPWSSLHSLFDHLGRTLPTFNHEGNAKEFYLLLHSITLGTLLFSTLLKIHKVISVQTQCYCKADSTNINLISNLNKKLLKAAIKFRPSIYMSVFGHYHVCYSVHYDKNS